MQAFQITAFDTPPTLRDIPRPDPGPGQVRVKIAACGLNFADLLMMRGTYQDTPDPPFTLGMEVAGTVEATGPDTPPLTEGSRVAVFSGQGGLAEYGVFDAARCVPLPDTMPFDIAAGFLVAYGTSHLALTRRAGLTANDRLVVLGAAGGVGLTAVELGARTGAEVTAVARGADRLAVAKAAGARHLIDTTETPDLRAALKDLGGFDILYDTVGGSGFDAALRAARPEARLLSIGFASGDIPQIPANLLLVKNLTVMGMYWGGYLRFAPDMLTDSLTELMRLYQNGDLHPHIGATFPLAHAADALAHLKSRAATGKVVVTM